LIIDPEPNYLNEEKKIIRLCKEYLASFFLKNLCETSPAFFMFETMIALLPVGHKMKMLRCKECANNKLNLLSSEDIPKLCHHIKSSGTCDAWFFGANIAP
jgi:hypothetical protein